MKSQTRKKSRRAVTETVGEALEQNRVLFRGQVKSLVLCKNELFYEMAGGFTSSLPETVYPVTMELAKKEADFFRVEVSEE